MALFLFGLGAWALYGAIWAPHVHPKYRRRPGAPKSFSETLADVSPGLERAFSKGVVLLGGVALIAGGVYILVHRWE